MKGSVRGYIMKSVLLLSGLVLMLAFQNCGGAQFGSLGSSASEGNGHGYTGKATYVASDAACSDGIRAKIVLATTGAYYLTRRDCAELLVPQIIEPAISGSDPSYPNQLVYAGLTFELQPASLPGSGYFVLTESTYLGDFGGLAAANAACLTELQAKDWMGKSDASSRGLLVSSKVRAFLCDGSSCQNATASATYAFARAGATNAGGRTFTADASGTGPSDRADWDAQATFRGDYFVWTGRTSTSDSLWAASDTNHCTGWTTTTGNGQEGGTNYTNKQRWENGAVACSSSRRLICFVDP